MTDQKSSARPLRIGLLGCGRIAEHHVRFVKTAPETTLVAVADANPEQARDFAERHAVSAVHGSLEELLAGAPLDVLHVLTPPADHYASVLRALEKGIHVFVEKPVALAASEVEHLYQVAAARGVLLCPDFIQLFHPKMRQAICVIESGDLGRPMHVEAHVGVDLEMPEVTESQGLHWSYRLPGGVLQNTITHPLYKVLYFTGAPKSVQTVARSMGTMPQAMTDHLSIQIEGEQCTGSVLLSTVTRPHPYDVVVYCERGSVSVNFVTSTIMVKGFSPLPRVIQRVLSNFFDAKRMSSEAIANIFQFVTGKLVPYQGLQSLIPSFYESIRRQIEPPVSPALAIAVTKAEGEIFRGPGKFQLDLSPRPSRQQGVTQQQKVLVTGATGYVGLEVIKKLVKEGYYVRALVRPLSHVQRLEGFGVECVIGDIRNPAAVNEAASGIDVIVHLAAGLRGTAEFMLRSCVQGTRNVADAAAMHRVERVIYVSSFSVYDYSRLADGDVIEEDSPLEEMPEARGASSLAKRQAEEIALQEAAKPTQPWTILRPSYVMGGKRPLSSAVGVQIGQTVICLGGRKKQLRLIHLEEVASAILALMNDPKTAGRIFTLSGEESIAYKDFVEQCLVPGSQAKLHVVYVPYFVAALGVLGLTCLRRITGKGPAMNRRRLDYLYRDVTAGSKALSQATGWRPAAGLLERLKGEALQCRD